MGFWHVKGRFLIYRLIKVLGLVTLALVTLANDNCKDEAEETTQAINHWLTTTPQGQMIYASVVQGVPVVPKDSKIYVPSPILFRGFMPLLDGFKSGIPAQDGAVVTGTLLINTDTDSEAESPTRSLQLLMSAP